MMPQRKTPPDSITAVPGVHVGHVTLSAGEIQTGATAILPYPLTVRDRKLFLGSFAGGGWQEWTGLHVADDFGTFSSPLVLCNATTVGIAYDALISFGHRREPGLPIDNAWPPVVIGLDDGYLNDLRQRRITQDDVLNMIHGAQSHAAGNGSLGIGRGLCAFGGKGGVGEAARLVTSNGADFIVGALVAANGGKAMNAQTQRARNLTSSFVVIVATDAPLLPEQLRGLAEAAMRGCHEFEWDPLDRQLALAFSTSNTIEGAFHDSFQLFKLKHWAEEFLSRLFAAAAAASRAALLNGLRAATAVTGRKGRTAHPVAFLVE